MLESRSGLCAIVLLGQQTYVEETVLSATTELLLPARAVQGEATDLCERPDTLVGKTVGIVWNSKPNGDALFQEFVDRAAESHQIGGVRWFRKPNAANGAQSSLLDEVAARCDAALVALGD